MNKIHWSLLVDQLWLLNPKWPILDNKLQIVVKLNLIWWTSKLKSNQKMGNWNVEQFCFSITKVNYFFLLIKKRMEGGQVKQVVLCTACEVNIVECLLFTKYWLMCTMLCLLCTEVSYLVSNVYTVQVKGGPMQVECDLCLTLNISWTLKGN